MRAWCFLLRTASLKVVILTDNRAHGYASCFAAIILRLCFRFPFNAIFPCVTSIP